MNLRRRLLCWCVVVLLLPLTGCPRITERLASRRLDDFVLLAEPDAAELAESVRSSAAKIQSFKGLATVVAEGLVGSERGRQSVLFARPNELRVETFEPAANRLASLITVNDGMLKAIIAKERRAYVGEATPTIMERFVFLPLDVESIMLLLVGRFNLDALPGIVASNSVVGALQWRRSPASNSVLLYAPLQSGELIVEGLFKPQGSELLLDELLLYERATRQLRVKVIYNYQATMTSESANARPDSVPSPLLKLPKSLRIELPQKRAVIELTFTASVLNAKIAEHRFSLEIPPGLEVIQMDS